MTIVEGFERYIGTREYDGIIAEIQKWYYGFVSKTPWCATSTSYFADKAGVLDQLGGRNEGVYEMMNACREAWRRTRKGQFYDRGQFPEIIPRGAVIFFQRLGVSHVAHCYEPTRYNSANSIKCIGGNQSDSICVKPYTMAAISAIFVPDYGEQAKRPTIYKGYKDAVEGGSWCATLQKGLNSVMHAGLDVDGSCGAKTDAAIRRFQSVNDGLVVDGRFGPRSWAKLDELVKDKRVWIKTIPEGMYTYTETMGDYGYIPDLGIWVHI